MGRVPECPLQIGQRVSVSRSVPFCSDWPGEYVVTAIRWEYRGNGEIDISIASDDEIQSHYGDTDGFSVADLIPVTSGLSPHGR